VSFNGNPKAGNKYKSKPKYKAFGCSD
jgi:hypothetical protein